MTSGICKSLVTVGGKPNAIAINGKTYRKPMHETLWQFDYKFRESHMHFIKLVVICIVIGSKTCLATVLFRSMFAREKLYERFSASAVLTAQNRTNEHSSKTCFALITHLLSTQSTKSWKMFMNNKFKAQSLNRKSYRKFTLSCLSVTCFKHVGSLWQISALDKKQVRG